MKRKIFRFFSDTSYPLCTTYTQKHVATNIQFHVLFEEIIYLYFSMWYFEDRCLNFLFWPLWCMSFIDLRTRITPIGIFKVILQYCPDTALTIILMTLESLGEKKIFRFFSDISYPLCITYTQKHVIKNILFHVLFEKIIIAL